MSDLIERLRDEAVKVMIERTGDKGLSSKDITGSVIWQSADEIERLRSRMVNGPLEEVAGYAPEAFPMSSDYNKFDPIDYALHYGGRCRDCADADGVCPSSGMPCDPTEARNAAGHVLKAWAYGIQHGYMENPFALTPAKQAEGQNQDEAR